MSGRWETASLQQCVDVLDHLRVPVNADERSRRPGGIPYFGATGQVGWIDDYIFDEELLLVGEDGAPFFDKSKPITYLINGKSWVNNHAHVLRPRLEVLEPGFLKHYLDQFDFHGFVDGTTRLKLKKSNLDRIPIPLPSKGQQRRIVAEIDKQVTRLDAAQSALQRSQANLKKCRTSAIEAAFDSHSGAPIRHLRDLGQIVGGLTKGQKRKDGTRTRPVPYLRVANVQRGHLNLDEIKLIEATEQEIRSLQLMPGDVLLNEGGDRDKLGRGWIWEGQISECIHQNHVFRVRLNPLLAIPRFVSHYANHFGQKYFFDEGKQTTNLASINMTKLRALPIPSPPVADQEKLIADLEDQLSIIDNLDHSVDIALRRTDSLRQAILKKAFEGKLVPQDPNDEPASVLLERIRAARTHTPARRAQRKREANA